MKWPLSRFIRRVIGAEAAVLREEIEVLETALKSRDREIEDVRASLRRVKALLETVVP